MYIPLLAAALVTVPVAVGAQPPQSPAPAKPGSAVVLSLPSNPAPGPYAKLFSGTAQAGAEGGQWRIIPKPKQDPPAVQGESRTRQTPRTKVVCGMTLILVDPAEIDPKMPIPTPKDGTRYTMRNFPPPACRDK